MKNESNPAQFLKATFIPEEEYGFEPTPPNQDKNPMDKNPPDINPRTKTPLPKTPRTKTPQTKLMNTKYILHK